MMKKILLTGLCLSLTACGFTPMHAPKMTADSGNFKNIGVELIEPSETWMQEAGYHVQQSLYDRLGQNSGRHVLKIEPKSSRRNYGLTSNDVASRYDMVVTVDYELIDTVTGKILDDGEVRSTSTFGAARDPYARISAEKDASKQAARDAADRIIVRLASYYNKNKTP